nr:GNAT family N-acetyltransferase [Mesorhizobium sp. NBSH29]
MLSPPVLETQRLILRGHLASDFDAIAALWGDETTARFTTGKPSTRNESWQRLLRYTGLWPMLGFGYWAVTEKESGLYLGDIGFLDMKRDLQPSIEGFPEAGWVLHPSVRGRGIAVEAMDAALDWAQRSLPHKRAVCLINPENHSSLRVAAKLGFVEYTRSQLKDEDLLLLERALR